MPTTNGVSDWVNWKNLIAVVSIAVIVLIAVLNYFQNQLSEVEAVNNQQQANIAVLAEQNKQVTDRLVRIENKLDKVIKIY